MMEKYPKIRYPSDPQSDGILDGDVVVLEKLDGANFRFTWDDDGELWIGTRNHVYKHDDENIPKTFSHAVEYITQTVPEDTPQEKSNYTVYGEAMHIHSLDYTDIDWHVPSSGSAHVPLDSELPNVVAFDVRDNITGKWLSWPACLALFNDFNLQHAKEIEKGDPSELSLEIPEESVFGGPPEGIVVRRIDGTVRAKKVTDAFKEKNAVTFNDAAKASSDAGEFVATYVTDARIEKIALKLVDEGKYDALQMEMMQDLPREVLADVMAEEGWNLLTSGSIEVEWDDDFKSEVRSKTSKKCARALKEKLQSF